MSFHINLIFPCFSGSAGKGAEAAGVQLCQLSFPRTPCCRSSSCGSRGGQGRGLPEAGPLGSAASGQYQLGERTEARLQAPPSSASLLRSPGSRRGGTSTQAPAPGFREGQGSPFTFSKMPVRNYYDSASDHRALRYCASPLCGEAGLRPGQTERRRQAAPTRQASRYRGVSAGHLSCLTQAARVAGSSSPQVSSVTATCPLWGFRVDSSPFRHRGKAQVAEAATPLGGSDAPSAGPQHLRRAGLASSPAGREPHRRYPGKK